MPTNNIGIKYYHTIFILINAPSRITPFLFVYEINWIKDTKISYVCPDFVSRMSFLGLVNCNSPRVTIIINTVYVCDEFYWPQRDKTNKMTCAPNEDSDQPGHPPSMTRVFAVHSVGS